LRLAREALRRRGAAPIVLNAANEVAVSSFLAEEIGFLDIPRVVERALEKMPDGPLTALSDVMEIDREARMCARSIIRAFC
jgi:1-deoxy-D-xylulose-5-phosphate reductoisomerase